MRKKTNITAKHQRHFDALRNPQYGNFALFSGFVNGEPTSIIVAVSQAAEGALIEVSPLFVAVTPGMVLTDHEGSRPVTDVDIERN
jgi:hypothetical protein